MADIENELREITIELARSIGREIDLEDLVERLQSEGPDVNRRTSDYFSDSGTSSIRYASDPGKSEEIEKIRRAAAQERAQLKVDLSQKLQDERSQRLASESHVQILESQVQQVRGANDVQHATTDSIYLAPTRKNGHVRFVIEN